MPYVRNITFTIERQVYANKYDVIDEFDDCENRVFVEGQIIENHVTDFLASLPGVSTDLMQYEVEMGGDVMIDIMSETAEPFNIPPLEYSMGGYKYRFTFHESEPTPSENNNNNDNNNNEIQGGGKRRRSTSRRRRVTYRKRKSTSRSRKARRGMRKSRRASRKYRR